MSRLAARMQRFRTKRSIEKAEIGKLYAVLGSYLRNSAIEGFEKCHDVRWI